MANVTLKGNPIKTLGRLPAIGVKAPNFRLVNNKLEDVTLEDYKGTKLILNIFPSIDTGTCAASVKKFNKEVTDINNVKVLCISKDLPFAQSRFCGAEGIKNVELLSDFRNGNFGKAYRLTFTNGPLEGLLSRSIIVLNEEGFVLHSEQVKEIVDEPNYEAAFRAVLSN